MARLFSPIQIRDLKIKNRIFVSPMCQYSSHDGLANNWHLVHLGSRATGGAGLVMTEATSISPEGRISPNDLGLWSEEHAQALKPITEFIHSQGAISAVQLAHAGRKAGTALPWKGGQPLSDDEGGWSVLGPSALAYNDKSRVPKEMDEKDIQKVISDFEKAAEFSKTAGFQVIEIHMAHGYLLHEFLSPLSNQRKDQYGGALENRMRLPLEIARRLRALWPAELPVLVRISASDWVEGGWDLQQSVILCSELKKIGIDLIDVSSGGLSPNQKIENRPNYQVPFSNEIRKKTGVLTGAVGLITEAQQAEDILSQGQADVVLLARELLRDPYWPLHAAHQLGAEIPWPSQYLRAKPK